MSRLCCGETLSLIRRYGSTSRSFLELTIYREGIKGVKVVGEVIRMMVVDPTEVMMLEGVSLVVLQGVLFVRGSPHFDLVQCLYFVMWMQRWFVNGGDVPWNL